MLKSLIRDIKHTRVFWDCKHTIIFLYCKKILSIKL